MSHAASNEHPSRFATTKWTRVLASRLENPEGREALSGLCAIYYRPVVSFLRREGRAEDEARELAHDFFARVLRGGTFRGADPRRGRFRSYLLGALKHFLVNQRAHELREKRGACVVHDSLSVDTTSENRFAAQAPVDETAFDRDWAVAVLDRALRGLKEENEREGAGSEYEALKPWLTGEAASSSRAEAARKLGISDGALRVAIHRLRRRFRELVRAEVARTVDDPAEIGAEMNHLINALG